MKAKICFVLFCLTLSSLALFAQTADNNSSAFELLPRQEKSYNLIKAAYALEITEIMHSTTIKDKNAAMGVAWRERNEKLKALLLKGQFEAMLEQEETPLFLKQAAQKKVEKNIALLDL